MTVPIYLFSGFLESGKTTVVKETLLDAEFNGGEKTLLLVCEEGMEEYDDAFLKKTNTTLRCVEHEEDLTYKFLKQCDSTVEPDRVMIEFNGTWNLTNFLTVELPYEWLLVQIFSTIDAGTFGLYINNMKSMLFEQLVHSDTILFNRCDESTKKLFLRNNIKAINKGAQLIYEAVDGSINSLSEDELPFDLEADVIEISDDDYGLFYMDALEHVKKYEGKRIRLKAKMVNHIEEINNAFVLGRSAMVCCADDTSLIGFVCHSKKGASLLPNEWIEVEAQVEVEYDNEYHGDVPVLYALDMKSVAPLEDEFVYFT